MFGFGFAFYLFILREGRAIRAVRFGDGAWRGYVGMWVQVQARPSLHKATMIAKPHKPSTPTLPTQGRRSPNEVTRADISLKFFVLFFHVFPSWPRQEYQSYVMISSRNRPLAGERHVVVVTARHVTYHIRKCPAL